MIREGINRQRYRGRGGFQEELIGGLTGRGENNRLINRRVNRGD